MLYSVLSVMLQYKMHAIFRKMDPKLFYKKSKITVRFNDVLDLTMENSLKECIHPVLPPENATGFIIDEDSGDEDGAGTINNLPGSMFRAESAVDDSSSDKEHTESPLKKESKRTPVYVKGYQGRFSSLASIRRSNPRTPKSTLEAKSVL